MPMFDTVLDIGRVVATKIGTRASSVIGKIRGASASDDESPSDDVNDAPEDIDDVDVWGSANLLYRPLDPTDAGACEAVFIRRGDTREVIATKDRRWQVSLEQGEVIVRNVVADADKRITIKLAQNGTLTITAKKAVIASDDIRLTSASPADHPSLASKCDQRNDKVAQALDAFAAAAPVPNDGGAAIHTAFVTVWGTPPTAASDVGSTKVSTD